MQRIRIKCLPASFFKLSGSHFKKNIKKIKKVVDIFCPLPVSYTHLDVYKRQADNTVNNNEIANEKQNKYSEYRLDGIVLAAAGIKRIGRDSEIKMCIRDRYKAALAAGLSKEQALAACGRMSRDNARTPMQWLSLIHIFRSAAFIQNT